MGVIVKAVAMNLVDWQMRFGTEEACAEALKQQRWPYGFQCPKCGHAASCHQSVPGAVVFGDRSDGQRQGRTVRPAPVQADQGVLGLRPIACCAKFARPWGIEMVSIDWGPRGDG